MQAHLSSASRKLAFSGRSCQRTTTLLLEPLEARCLLSADMILQWNQYAIDAVGNDYNVGHTPDQGGPTRTARALAIVQAAAYDAVDAIIPVYAPYLVSVHPQPGTSMNAGVAQAAHDTLVALFPQQTATFDAELTQSLQGIPPAAAQKGIAMGQNIAAQILAARQNDGSAINPVYTPGIYPGQWRPDPVHPTQTALTPGWGYVAPFAIQSGAQFQVPPPPALTSPQYTAGFNLEKMIGGDGIDTPTTRTAEQTLIGQFWGYDGSPGLGTPPREYNQIMQIVAQQEGNNIVQNARLFALVNLAMADAGITAWYSKYIYNYWRPVAAIREADPGTGPTGFGDGNPNTHGNVHWTPLGGPQDNGGANGPEFTPNFPAYVSGHATFGAALFRILADFYHNNNIGFSWMSDEYNGVTVDQYGNVRPPVTRHYSSLSQAAYENAESRIYLGIHWPWDRDDGLMQGTAVADYVFQHVLQPLSGHVAGELPSFSGVIPAPGSLAPSLEHGSFGKETQTLPTGLATNGLGADALASILSHASNANALAPGQAGHEVNHNAKVVHHQPSIGGDGFVDQAIKGPLDEFGN